MSSDHQVTSETWVVSQIWLHHKRLGHSPFGSLKSLFSHLFTKDVMFVKFLNTIMLPFFPSNSKNVAPFDLIHFEVQGHVTESISEVRWFVTFIDDCTPLTLVNPLKDSGHTMIKASIKWGCIKKESSSFLDCQSSTLSNVHSKYLLWRSCSNYHLNKLLTHVLQGISPVEWILSFFSFSPLLLSLSCRVFGCVAFVHYNSPKFLITIKSSVLCVNGCHISRDTILLCQPSTLGRGCSRSKSVLGSLPLLSLQDVQHTNHENIVVNPR
ncbi:hypothetical protein CR513_11340, partial [Mucuna pruriens]